MVSGGPIYPQLSVNTSADVCVIGGGLAGLTTAYLLTRDGASVIVLEDGFIGSGRQDERRRISPTSSMTAIRSHLVLSPQDKEPL